MVVVARMLAADLYRLAHGRMLWGFLVALAGILVAMTAFLWWSTTDSFARTVGEGGVSVGVSATGESASLGVSVAGGVAENPYAADDAAGVMQSHTYAYAGMLVSGGFLPLFVSIMAVVIVCGDYETGFAKSLLVPTRSRTSYLVARLVLVAVLSAVVFAVGVAVLEAGFAVVGFTYRAQDTAGQWWGYVGLGVLSTMCYATLALFVAQLTKSKVAGIVCAVLVSSGMIGSAISSALGAISAAVPWVADVLAWLPSSCLALMTGGAQALFSAGDVAGLAAPVHAAVAFVLWTAAAGSLTVLAGARQSVA